MNLVYLRKISSLGLLIVKKNIFVGRHRRDILVSFVKVWRSENSLWPLSLLSPHSYHWAHCLQNKNQLDEDHHHHCHNHHNCLYCPATDAIRRTAFRINISPTIISIIIWAFKPKYVWSDCTASLMFTYFNWCLNS